MILTDRQKAVENVACIHCHSENVNKAGFTHNRKQRYYCRNCRRFSRENPIFRKKLTVEPTIYIAPQKIESLPSESHLILKIKALAQRLGRTPTTTDAAALAKQKKGYPLDVYYAVFGSFNELLTRAKLPLVYRQEFDKDKLIAELKKLRRETGRALIGKDVSAARKKGKVSSIYHFQRAFGSVPAAIDAANAGRRLFTKDEIKNYLIELRAELKREPTGKEIAERFVPGETPSLKEIQRVFGTLTAAKNSSV